MRAEAGERRAFLPELISRLEKLGAQVFLEHRTIGIKELIGTGKGQILFSQVDIPQAAEYASEDADVTWRVASILCPRIDQEGLGDLFRNVELPLIPVLVDMELAGVRVDTTYLQELSEEFGKVLGDMVKKVNQLQQDGDKKVSGSLSGEEDLHEAMLSLEKANLSLKVLLQVRNKLIAAYEELNRMPL